MKNFVLNIFKKITTMLCIVLILFSVMCNGVVGVALAADDFEQQIAEFPESYKVYLRQLHEKYPLWKFEALETELDWEKAVAEEDSENRNLVQKNTSHFMKSRKPGDYIRETDTYIEKDAGWVSASSIAVSHFMDPRNFLNETDIFQFERLSFSDVITVETVEEVLKNTFMHDQDISYYDSDGNLITVDKTYAEVIYDAGKAYNINPCYLASKIRNEVVISAGAGSGSVSGNYEGFEGIYNFYNIGASDGTNPIKTGLEWASNTNGTYLRPWTDPEKSICGGAMWLAENYIAKGQDTGYLQKFNVNPEAEFPVYTHQYMTNVSGADSQGRSTYLSYKNYDLLSVERVFRIPVFDNMPGSDVQAAAVVIENYGGVYATVNYSSVNLRSTASTFGSIVTKLPYGTRVKILSDLRVDSNDYSHYLNNPFWCKVKTELNGNTYTGYMSADYLTFDISSKILAGTTLKLSAIAEADEKPSYYSADETVAVVDKQGMVTTKKCGITDIYVTTSKGGFDIFSLEVEHSFSYWMLQKQPSCKENGINIRCCLFCDYSETSVIPATDNHKNFVVLNSVAPTYTKIGLTEGQVCGVCGKTIAPQRPVAKLTLDMVEGLKVNKVKVAKSSEITLAWNKVGDGVEYEIYRYVGGKWKLIKTTAKTSYTVKKLKAGKSYSFKVRAVVEGVIPGAYSDSIRVKTIPETTSLKLKPGKKQLTAIWSKTSDISGYELQYSTSKKFSKKTTKKAAAKKSSKKATIKKLKKNKKYYVRIRTYKTVNGKRVYSDWSKVKSVKVK